jgi:hypothetical protein
LQKEGKVVNTTKRGKKGYKIAAMLLIIISGILFLPSIKIIEGIILNTNHDNELCSVLTTSNGDKVLFGGNVDTRPEKYSGTSPYVVVFPPSEEDNMLGSGYGFVAIGWEWEEEKTRHKHFACGLNEKGLAFGTNGLPESLLNPCPDGHQSDSKIFQVAAMRECSSVNCVIEMAKTFDWGDSISMQIHFADATGDAVVISAGKDGELAFTQKDNQYLVSTNFNRANPENGTYPCWRYDTAVKMLEVCDDDLTIEYIESILDTIHVEGRFVNTVYSYIFDLRTGDCYVYYFHQFDEVVEFNILIELAESTNEAISEWYPFESLFSQETLNKAASELWEYQKWIIALKIGFGTSALLGFCYFVYRKGRNHK